MFDEVSVGHGDAVFVGHLLYFYNRIVVVAGGKRFKLVARLESITHFHERAAVEFIEHQRGKLVGLARLGGFVALIICGIAKVKAGAIVAMRRFFEVERKLFRQNVRFALFAAFLQNIQSLAVTIHDGSHSIRS